MKYCLELVFVDDEFKTKTDYSKIFSDLIEAEETREEIRCSDSNKGYHCTWDKLFPVVKCSRCGEDVYCTSFTNDCDCNMLYNFAGQELAPVEEWGEETGEHWTECW